jgi:hypothetical protein
MLALTTATLQEAFYKGGVTRPTELHKLAKGKTTLAQVKTWLDKQESVQLHKVPPKVKREQYRPILATDVNDTWMADTTFFNGQHIIVAVDIFSRRAYARLVSNGSATASRVALESIFQEANGQPIAMQTDNGGEFEEVVNQLFEERGIAHFTSRAGEHKAQSVIERFNRTLKTRLTDYKEKHGGNIYQKELQAVVERYNDTPHSTTGLKPFDVQQGDERIHRKNEARKSRYTAKAHGLKEGDTVRILLEKTALKKGYAARWTSEIYELGKEVGEGSFKVHGKQGRFRWHYLQKVVGPVQTNPFKLKAEEEEEEEEEKAEEPI